MSEREFNPADYGKPNAEEAEGETVLLAEGVGAVLGVPTRRYVSDQDGVVWLLPRNTHDPRRTL